MASQFFGLNIASSALSAYQAAVNTTANNIANVRTEGYSRQQTTLESALAIRVNARYGSMGSGVVATEIKQIRDVYYDQKYWQNNSNLGMYEQKIYYLSQVEDSFADDSVQQGFSTIFSKMFNSLDTLKTNAADESVRNQFIHQSQNLCTYFNALATSLKGIQEDCNEEIKNAVDNINALAEKISLLNNEINRVEVAGGYANELRDERAKLLDQLSSVVKVEANEYAVTNTNGANLGGTTFIVEVNGQILVDGGDFRQLECISYDYRKNQTDAKGMYYIVWEDTKTNFAATTGTAGGSLKALFDLRDGNHQENLQGNVIEATGNRVVIENPTITKVNSLNIPDYGAIEIRNRIYYYDSWDAELDADGNIVSFTFNLKEAIPQEDEAYILNENLSCGDCIDAMGIPYYQQQINEFVRNFSELFNDIQKKGVDLYGNPMSSFFEAQTQTGKIYDFDQWGVDADGNRIRTISSTSDTYYQLMAENFSVKDAAIKDPGIFATTVSIVDGADAYDLIEEIMNLQTGVKMFRGENASSFLETLLSDISVDTEKNNTYYVNYNNLESVINNQRMSVSGVDEDEEGVNLIKFQNAYNMSSKIISVLAEMYDKLINETGIA